ncbi:Clp protease ClpP [Pseudomonas sp. 21LCFQ02]|uniref:head maturation protease, ClpP-related n=1 Tax=Pseudomonas sp. 21LCFQ02 TaxID=2957505 RepID=UPI00209AAC2C|nr:head maturation protease, ClpP-related [Pseudomonas sp. 21LCFQ02]MCO8167860.1 Clp protease ClpP [Pseudomonas sp. 21LCFQ02]
MSKAVAPVLYNNAGKKVQVNAEHWYQIQASTEAGQPIEVFVYGEIGGWGVTANQFVQDLRAVDDGLSEVIVAFNSPGGDLFEGLAIHNALARLGERGVGRVDALAASAASVAVCGAHKVVMTANAMMMIHNPWTWAAGDADDLRHVAGVLDQTLEAIVAAYKAKAPNIDEAELRRLIDAETWLTANEAKALGLADEVGSGVEVKACLGQGQAMKRFRNTPKSLSEPAEPSGPDKPAEPETSPVLALLVTQTCRDAGISNLVDPIISNTKLASEAVVKAALTQAKEVHNLCVAARLPELAAEYVTAGLDTTAVRARLFEKVVGSGKGIEIDSSLPIEDDPATKPQAKQPDVHSIYAARRAAQPGNQQSNRG